MPSVAIYNINNSQPRDYVHKKHKVYFLLLVISVLCTIGLIDFLYTFSTEYTRCTWYPIFLNESNFNSKP